MAGCKSYSKTKPMRIEEFGPEKAWQEKHEKNEQAWKVGVGQIKASGYNLDSEPPMPAKPKATIPTSFR